MTVWKH